MGENYRNPTHLNKKKILQNLFKARNIFGTAPAWTELGPAQPKLVNLFFKVIYYQLDLN